MVAAKIAKLPKGANQHTAIAAPSQADTASLLNVSPDSIQRARVVQREGSSELIAAVEADRSLGFSGFGFGASRGGSLSGFGFPPG